MTFSFNVKRSEINKKNLLRKSYFPIPPEAKKFLSPSKLVLTSGDVKKVAKRVTRGKRSILFKAEAIYDYIVENYQRDETIKGCGTGAVCKILKSKKGKCADIHSVFAALARSIGAHAKEIFGIRIPKGKSGDMTKAFHCRAEFYLPGSGWIPVDASDVSNT